MENDCFCKTVATMLLKEVSQVITNLNPVSQVMPITITSEINPILHCVFG